MNNLAKVLDYFRIELEKSNIARQYLKSRGIEAETIYKFQLGYCPGDPKFVPRFRDRIIFPIWDQHSELVGWTGRTLVNAPAKYVNVKESVLYKKSRLLYAYNFAKASIIDTGEVILVEGQMDALILHQVGFTNTVATSGTASFKLAAASLVARYDPKVFIVFDGDSAGIKAAVSAEVHLKSVGVTNVVNVQLPEGEDPASFVLKKGRHAFLKLLQGNK